MCSVLFHIDNQKQFAQWPMGQENDFIYDIIMRWN